MRLAFLSVIGCLLASTFVASAQDKKTPQSQEALLGEWVNVTKDDARLFPRFVVSQKGDAWWIEVWFDNGGGPDKGVVPLGKGTLSLLGDNAQAKSLPYAFATLDGKNYTLHMTLRLVKDEMVAETFMIFKDKSLGSNYRTQGKFKKK